MSTTHVVMNVSDGHINRVEFLVASSDRDCRLVGTEDDRHKHCAVRRGVLPDDILYHVSALRTSSADANGLDLQLPSNSNDQT